MRSPRLSWFFASVALSVALFAARPARAGYTHYWEWHSQPDPKALAASVADMNRIVEARRRSLADGKKRTGPEAVFLVQQFFGDAGVPVPAIVFNGIGEGGHEWFGFPLAPFTSDDPSFQFVKTAYKPYDEVATACLIVARDYFPKEVLTISSDGEWGEWKAGALLYARVLDRAPHNPLGEDKELSTPNEGQREAWSQEPRVEQGSVRKNLLVSALVFLALAVTYLLLRRRR